MCIRDRVYLRGFKTVRKLPLPNCFVTRQLETGRLFLVQERLAGTPEELDFLVRTFKRLNECPSVCQFKWYTYNFKIKGHGAYYTVLLVHEYSDIDVAGMILRKNRQNVDMVLTQEILLSVVHATISMLSFMKTMPLYVDDMFSLNNVMLFPKDQVKLLPVARQIPFPQSPMFTENLGSFFRLYMQKVGFMVMDGATRLLTDGDKLTRIPELLKRISDDFSPSLVEVIKELIEPSKKTQETARPTKRRPTSKEKLSASPQTTIRINSPKNVGRAIIKADQEVPSEIKSRMESPNMITEEMKESSFELSFAKGDALEGPSISEFSHAGEDKEWYLREIAHRLLKQLSTMTPGDRRIVEEIQQNLKRMPKLVKIVYEDDSVYIGTSSTDDQVGCGFYFYPGGDIYAGDWKNESLDGCGLYLYTSGEKYEGELQNGMKHGRGLYSYSNGDYYKGEWKNDKKEGIGMLCLVNRGETYEGEWVAGFKHGRGIYHHSNNEVTFGRWFQDKLVVDKND
eukprot:TRINITY_DN7532_c0_g2_i2.p1 TRINITY_DN7532_c0_g2~~TRINITY_DN7532_c0_g2_i2.p1  ORF type:complete len:511 (-),score=93.87 TRINITY_DN7532_c0_g2_i2:101-1633(-)